MKHHSTKLILAILLILAFLTTGNVGAQPNGEPLANALNSLVEQAELGRDTKLAAVVMDAKTGEIYVDENGLLPLRPASVLKLITSASALQTLGPDYRYETRVHTWDKIDRGVLRGNLVLEGGGDPTLGPRFQTEKPSDVRWQLDQWAKQLRKDGIKEITGNIIADDRRYSDDRHAIGWEATEFAEWYSSEVSALTYNDNCIDIIWQPKSSIGSRVDYRLEPNTNYVTIASTVRVGSPRMNDSSIRYFRFKSSNEIRARGRIAPKASAYDYAAVHDPARFAGHLFREALVDAGIKVGGNSFSRRQLINDDPTTAPLVLIQHESPPLSRILGVVNSESQNLYAELIGRELALAFNEEPTFMGAGRAVNKWLRNNGLQRSGFAMVDASGLSSVNQVPARLIADVMLHMNRSAQARLYRDTLALPGTRTMRTRFLGGDYSVLQDNLRAKTGYIDRTHSLAGYISNHRGSDYIFVLMLNDFDEKKTSEARELIDQMVLEIFRSEILP